MGRLSPLFTARVGKGATLRPLAQGQFMLNFDFHNPTRILFGQGRIADLDKQVPATAKVLILVGGASAEKRHPG